MGGLFAGRLADTRSRRNLIVGAVLGWSAATAALGLAHGFAAVLAARLALGLSQSLTAPACSSLLGQSFPVRLRGQVNTTAGHLPVDAACLRHESPSKPKQRTVGIHSGFWVCPVQANAVYALGIYLGGSAASLSQLLCAGGLGWRNTYLLVATMGVFVAVVTAAFVREPPRPTLTAPTGAALPAAATTAAATTPSHPLGVLGSARDVLRAPGIGWLYTAGTVRFLAGFTIMTFVPEYYRRTFPLHAASFSALNALAICVGGLLSSYAGGRIVDVVRPPQCAFFPDMSGRSLSLVPSTPCKQQSSLCVFVCETDGRGAGPEHSGRAVSHARWCGCPPWAACWALRACWRR